MKYNPDIHHRCSIRLKHYDYSQAGAYFITICTQNRECLFGEIKNGEMHLNGMGEVVVEEWLNITKIRHEIELDAWVVMPNHFHGIVIINTPVGAIHESPLRMTKTQRRNMVLPRIIGRFKMRSAKHINEYRQMPGVKLWQRNYWERIIRNENEFNLIREYIHNNPARWEHDQLFVNSAGIEKCNDNKSR